MSVFGYVFVVVQRINDIYFLSKISFRSYICHGHAMAASAWDRCHNSGSNSSPSLAGCKCRLHFLLAYWSNQWAPCKTIDAHTERGGGKSFCSYWGDRDVEVSIRIKFRILAPSDISAAVLNSDGYIKQLLRIVLGLALSESEAPIFKTDIEQIAVDMPDDQGANTAGQSPTKTAESRSITLHSKFLTFEKSASGLQNFLHSSIFRDSFKTELGAPFLAGNHKCRWARIWLKQKTKQDQAQRGCHPKLEILPGTYVRHFLDNAEEGTTEYNQAMTGIFQTTTNLISGSVEIVDEGVVVVEGITALSTASSFQFFL